ncbi:MAG: hypothetical protein OEY55_04215 [Acidimicrobiia bacterium]|nr:hypothetical protein [Acidimicrobiia bacterium]MDH5504321.1 hypothetical protein [Acidimicrobiia bacterium]
MSRTHVRAGESARTAGWRVWRVVRTDEDQMAALASTERQFIWSDRSVRARCLPPRDHFGVSDWYRSHRKTPDHAPPAVVCGCGIHAYWAEADALDDATLGRGTLRAVGQVELSERMLETEAGVRAEAARIVGPVWLVGECGHSSGDRLDCGNVATIAVETFVLRCSEHSAAGQVDAEQVIWSLCQQLESRYQVEVVSALTSSERHD